MRKESIDKSKLNIIIDIILLLLMMLIAGIGFLMKYVLVPGFERNVLYDGDIDLIFWGKTHHQWGSIHLILSIVFLVLLLLHIIFHWKMIINMFKRLVPTKIIRIGLVSLITIMGILFFSFPIFVKPKVVEKESLHRNSFDKVNHMSSDSLHKTKDSISMNRNLNIKEREKKHLHVSKEEIEVDGRETLQYVADKYDVPVNVIASDLKIPQTRCNEKLGRLKKQYSFTMDDIRASILNYKEENKQ